MSKQKTAAAASYMLAIALDKGDFGTRCGSFPNCHIRTSACRPCLWVYDHEPPGYRNFERACAGGGFEQVLIFRCRSPRPRMLSGSPDPRKSGTQGAEAIAGGGANPPRPAATARFRFSIMHIGLCQTMIYCKAGPRNRRPGHASRNRYRVSSFFFSTINLRSCMAFTN